MTDSSLTRCLTGWVTFNRLNLRNITCSASTRERKQYDNQNRLITSRNIFALDAILHSASFDCAKAKTKIGKLVCGDLKLSDLDEKLSALYKKVLELSPIREDSKKQQQDWMKGSRNTCKDAACLEEAYVSRISELERDLKNLPFKPSLEKPLLTLPAHPPEERIDATIIKKEPLELIGRVTANHDAAGGRYDINSAKTNYTIRYVWDLSDVQKDVLDKIQEANQYVVLKGSW